MIEVTPVTLGTEIGMLLKEKDHPGLWVVVNGDSEKQAKQLVGVLSPFELM